MSITDALKELEALQREAKENAERNPAKWGAVADAFGVALKVMAEPVKELRQAMSQKAYWACVERDRSLDNSDRLFLEGRYRAFEEADALVSKGAPAKKEGAK